MPAEEAAPDNANESCVGPTAETAGKASGCDGCPNQSACASGESKSMIEKQQQEQQEMTTALSEIQHVVLVLSGKGGVGKSTVACQLAHTLSSRGHSVGVLDVDICGPSVARMLGVTGHTVRQSVSGWDPVYINEHLSVMSVSFLLPDEDSAVVWRGPRKNGMISNFFTHTCWDDEGLDYLIIDTPPGTSDEHISTVQFLQRALDVNLGGAIVVSTPEEVSMADVRKELNFCTKTSLPVLGIVENMAGFKTPLKSLNFQSNNNGLDCTQDVLEKLQLHCPELLDVVVCADIFPASGKGPRGMAEKFNVPFLGSLPLDPNLLQACEAGKCFVQSFPDSAAVAPLNNLVDKLVEALPLDQDEDMDI
uniref:Cytosolic Fe-S cluster assembly factor NUBP1 homolog n=1 Tax=Eucampia antarctica TaxID=49252 RepID=A0A7S2VZM6_9STRA|mmetsp:Transcript_12687/g.12300  ORF Transcript_12687/g.12300 Transcript_12687/m.12300 type:complete len:364 (+) Transcript_12687:60-1151(+)|eukprot:CAMPEP_0197831380 /NCGR_PEP_ID=MMETSP1437-20131217/9655_1 /TAXON_ID=49252 ORGANISM="Eucampia antarctica, Strain CCMP1452" /NCGR_SAMPLE_ID=MMETSP1437 /ASSEMBLY_ACC=CAM_ASM_001096 /LENGTH=363 /DNA_ID=CAMNT_0043434277 /DNA_START=61 /DNA_END=1152 /DNA_ORIENTATION=+